MRVEVWRQPNGYWRWAYREGETCLLSNAEYTSEQAARHSADTAYPPPPPGRGEPPSRTGRLLSGLLRRFLLAVIAWRLLRRVRLRRGHGRGG
ncbi:hypothetical protein AB0L44_24830 [Nonomuraea wenchangensis]|uniref:hypothetical protein n=1 Tax=Nonomuraea wenchangensis TaxID=568860 RepID=UPI0034359D06